MIHNLIQLCTQFQMVLSITMEAHVNVNNIDNRNITLNNQKKRKKYPYTRGKAIQTTKSDVQYDGMCKAKNKLEKKIKGKWKQILSII